MSEVSAFLGIFLGQNVAFIGFVPFDFSRAGKVKSFSGPTMGFKLWHNEPLSNKFYFLGPGDFDFAIISLLTRYIAM